MIIRNGLGLDNQAWRIPALGRIADEDLPDWLLSAIERGSVAFHPLGGFRLRTDAVEEVALPGDIMVRDIMDGVVMVLKAAGLAAYDVVG